MTRLLSPALEQALEQLSQYEASPMTATDMAGALTDLAELSRHSVAVVTAYRALPAAPTGPWMAVHYERDGKADWVARTPYSLEMLHCPDQRTAETYRDALNVAEQAMEHGT